MIENRKIEINETKSSVYFLPIMNKALGFKFLSQLENSYLYNNSDDKVFSVLYKFKGTKEFLKYEEELNKHELFIGHEDYDEYVLYKFKIPEEYEEHLDILKEGKYSSFSESEKKDIILFARRRLFKNIDEISMILRGRKQLEACSDRDETFSNWIEEKKRFLDANALFKRRKKNE